MLKHLLVFSITALFIPTAAMAAGKIEAKKIWTLSEGFDAPESAFYDAKTDTIFISNISGKGTAKDGKGWISKVTPDGKYIQQKWIKGLNAPKGIRVQNGKLWVTDIDRVLAYDVKTGKQVQATNIVGSKFLNDVAIAPNGDVYVSDMITNTIHKIRKGQSSVFVSGKGWENPNGLLVQGPYLRVAAWGKGIKDDFSTTAKGSLYNINLKTKAKTPIIDALGHLDGLEAPGKPLDGFLVSDWMAGKVYSTGKGTSQLIIEGIKGAADIGYLPHKNVLILPEMGSNRVSAYQLSRKPNS